MSEEIVKTDPVAEMKARAREFWDIQADGRNVIDLMAAFAAKEVERATEPARLENARAMCSFCADSPKWKSATKNHDSWHEWEHSSVDGTDWATCHAALIWERAHGKGEKV